MVNGNGIASSRRAALVAMAAAATAVSANAQPSANELDDDRFAASIADESSQTRTTLNAAVVTVAPSSADLVVGKFPMQKTTGNKWHQGNHVFGNNTGLSAHPRQPFQNNQVIDGRTFVSGEYGSDVVGNVNAITFRGGFSAEAAFGTANPDDLVGANDYIITGRERGDIAGITSFYGRITEAHVNAPDAIMGTMSALTTQTSLGNGARSNNVYTQFVHAPAVQPGSTATNAYGVYLRKVVDGLGATNNWSLYSAGKAEFADTALFRGTLESKANQQAGTYLGRDQYGNAGILFASGSSVYRIANEDNALTFARPGAAVLLKVNFSGDLIPTGNIAVGAGKAITTDTVTGMRIGGSATQKIGFFGVTPVAQRPAAPSATNLATVIALANALRNDLIALGLKKAS